jgi:uncharacterized damage-inducible protein DinB
LRNISKSGWLNSTTATTPRDILQESMKTAWIAILFSALVSAQTTAKDDPYEGLWQGYDGEWTHVTKQVIALADAIPADKYTFRPEPGVRSTSEVMMHMATADLFLLSITGPKVPAGLTEEMEKTVTSKAEVIRWLKRSFDAVKDARVGLKPADFQRKVKVNGREATVDGMYLRIIVHANEHMGQLIAYARMMGVTPPWSEGAAK